MRISEKQKEALTVLFHNSQGVSALQNSLHKSSLIALEKHGLAERKDVRWKITRKGRNYFFGI